MLELGQPLHAFDASKINTELIIRSAGNTKTIKSTDDQGILMAILEVGNGNLELLTTGSGGMLCSQPWKHGAVRKLIGEERFEALFTTTVSQDLNTGKATRSLKTYDSQLVYKR